MFLTILSNEKSKSAKRLLRLQNASKESSRDSPSFLFSPSRLLRPFQISFPQQKIHQFPFPLLHQPPLLLRYYLLRSFKVILQHRLNLGELLFLGTQPLPLLFECWLDWAVVMGGKVARDVGFEGDSVDGVGWGEGGRRGRGRGRRG